MVANGGAKTAQTIPKPPSGGERVGRKSQVSFWSKRPRANLGGGLNVPKDVTTFVVQGNP